ncbi:unnamed protein product [Dicrocoelium dendriticum]|nr:unnamed protein product [Dicrocoelium dendriticum]
MAVSVEPVSQLSPLEFSVCHDEADCILMSENEAVVSKISQYLSGMQTTSNGTAVILGQLTTTELSTVDASEFCPFSNLTTLNAPRINASSSSFLEYLPNLVHVNLSYNELTEINGIPHCSCLETVGLAHNHLERLPDLSALKFLRKLDLNHNELTSIEGIRGCELLQWLHLGNNRLTASALMGLDTTKQFFGSVDSLRTFHQSSMNSSPPGRSLNIRPPLLSLTSLRVLNLSGNCDLSTAIAFRMTEQERTHLKQLGNSNSPQSTQDHPNVIQDSENYGIFPISVTHLYLSGCRISALSGLTALKHLNVLNLKDNEIVDNYELKKLHGLRLLRNLDMRNNPIWGGGGGGGGGVLNGGLIGGGGIFGGVL